MTLISGISVPVERSAEICRRYQVRELSLFGSSIRGDLRHGASYLKDILLAARRMWEAINTDREGPRTIVLTTCGLW